MRALFSRLLLAYHISSHRFSLLSWTVHHPPREAHDKEKQHGVCGNLEIEVSQRVDEHSSCGDEAPCAEKPRKVIATFKPRVHGKEKKRKIKCQPRCKPGHTYLRNQLQIIVVGMIDDKSTVSLWLVWGICKLVGAQTSAREWKIADQPRCRGPDEESIFVANFQGLPPVLNRVQSFPGPPKKAQKVSYEDRFLIW